MMPVIQNWVQELTLMQQSVLLTAIRGPDGVAKEHPAKEVLRWYRRCILLGAFEHNVFATPYEGGGGSFTGSAVRDIDVIAAHYFKSVDELPHHFQMHLMHAAEIVGYKHPVKSTRHWWERFYFTYVNALHLYPETEADMDRRLGDSESRWRAAECG
jgi:hypothetical protein